MSLVIKRENINLFSLTLTGEQPIMSEQNRLTTIGNFCNFKTESGANLILKQNILFSDITIIADTTETASSVLDLWIKLYDVGFFNGLFAGGGSGGVDRFTELLDTFESYVGRDEQVLIVNESQQRIETVAISLFTEELQTKLNGIQAKAEVNVQADVNETDPSSDAYIKNFPDITTFFSGIYLDEFTSDGTTNDFTLPIGAEVQNVWLDRGSRFKARNEWDQVDNILTIKGTTLTSGRIIDVSGMQLTV